MGAKNPYRKPDAFTLAAKAKGYPARSVFKLEEIDRRVRLFAPGQRVLDLGAAPGSWAMFAGERVGPKGKVLAVDLSAVTISLGANVEFIQGDALSLANEELARFAPYHVVISDMAPATMGERSADQARSQELFLGALEVAGRLLAPGGKFVGKIFMSGDFPRAKEAVRKAFSEVRIIRPEGTRANSYETFLIGLGKKGSSGAVRAR